MKTPQRAGFTLTELLAVVLIIGILAAVAAPFYRKAVARAKNREAVINLHAIARALQQYDMANTELPSGQSQDFALLGIEPPASQHFDYYYQCVNGVYPCYAYAIFKEELTDEKAAGGSLDIEVDRNGISSMYLTTMTASKPDKDGVVKVVSDYSYHKETCDLVAGRKEGDKCIVD